MSPTPANLQRARAALSRRSRGFTIPEVMMAAIVMAFALTTSITVMQRSFSTVDTARNLSYATQIMQNEFEKMRLTNWDAVFAYSTSETAVALDSSFTSNPYIGTRFTMTRIRSEVYPGTGKAIAKIVLKITWKSYDGRTLSRSLTTYYGQNGLYDYVYSQG
jgi:type II secretory pathway pseudopilin PulG